MLLHFETWNMFLFLFVCLPFSLAFAPFSNLYIYNINLLLFFATSAAKIISKRIVWCCCCWCNMNVHERRERERDSNKDKQAHPSIMRSYDDRSFFRWRTCAYFYDVWKQNVYTDSRFISMVIISLGLCVCMCMIRVLSFHSTLILMHIYVFECVSEFNFLEHLSHGYDVCENIFQNPKKNTNITMTDAWMPFNEIA